MKAAGTVALLFTMGGTLLYPLFFAYALASRGRTGGDPAVESALLLKASVLPLVLSAAVTAVGTATVYHCPLARLPHPAGSCPIPLPHLCIRSKSFSFLLPLLRWLEKPSLLLLAVGALGYLAALVAAHLLPLPKTSALLGTALPAGLNPASVERALGHEAAHLLRRDHLASAAVELGRALFFWLPPARWLALAWRRAAEEAASEKRLHGRIEPVLCLLLLAVSATAAFLLLPTFHCAAEALLNLQP